MKTHRLKGVVVKVGLSKAFDWVSWFYVKILLTYLGFSYDFIRWIMDCLSSVSFVVLINGSDSHFFSAERKLHQGCPLSPLLFLLVAEGLSRFILAAKDDGSFKGTPISEVLYITHFLLSSFFVMVPDRIYLKSRKAYF